MRTLDSPKLSCVSLIAETGSMCNTTHEEEKRIEVEELVEVEAAHTSMMTYKIVTME